MSENLTTKLDRNNVECYTPKFAVDMVIPYLNKDKVIGAPFDLESSNFVRYLRDKGYKVIHSHIMLGQDFLTYEPQEHGDIILSNPPFKNKKQGADRAKSFNKPGCFLLPIAGMNDMNGNEIFDENIGVLIPNRRISFDGTVKTPTFKVAYFGGKIFPQQLQTINIEPICEYIPMYDEVEQLEKENQELKSAMEKGKDDY